MAAAEVAEVTVAQVAAAMAVMAAAEVACTVVCEEDSVEKAQGATGVVAKAVTVAMAAMVVAMRLRT